MRPETARRIINSDQFSESAKYLKKGTEGYRNNRGEWVEGTDIAIDVQVVCNAVDKTERQILPEGQNLADARKFWLEATDDVVVAALRDKNKGDKINYKDNNYSVIIVNDYQLHGFYEVLAVLQ